MTGEHELLIGLGIVIAILLLGGYWLVSKPDERIDKPLMGKEISSQGAPHVARGQSHPAYNSNPPTSGWHWGDGVAGPGIKDKQVPDELVLHSMEHGAVIVWYKTDLPKDQVDEVKKAYDSVDGKKILTPRKNLDVLVALTSWGRLLKLQTIDAEKIKAFIDTNSDRGPEKAPMY